MSIETDPLGNSVMALKSSRVRAEAEVWLSLFDCHAGSARSRFMPFHVALLVLVVLYEWLSSIYNDYTDDSVN